MSDNLDVAINALQKELANHERLATDIKTMINRLCVSAGKPALYQNVESGSQLGAMSIKADTFYGKSVIVAAREYLDMRKAADLGPASARDVYEALKSGGFAFGSTIEANAITVVRQAMAKQTAVFHRLPTGDYGLSKWYAKIKPRKVLLGNNGSDDSPDIEPADPEQEPADD